MSIEFEFVKLMSRHFVALRFRYQTFNEDGSIHNEGIEVFSGFIIELEDKWYWTTAGHCITDLDSAIKDGTLVAKSFYLVDSFGTDAEYTQAIPFTYRTNSAKLLVDRKKGFDFAFIELPDLIKKNLEANNIIPITESNWKHQKKLSFSHHKMLGIPNDSLDPNGGMKTLLIHINPLEKPEIAKLKKSELDPDYTKESWFYGKVDTPQKDLNIKGMSGGPIFGFRQSDSGNWYYHVVAVQSRWFNDTKITLGCSLPALAEEMIKIIKENQE